MFSEISNSDISDGKLSFVLSTDYSIKEYDLFGEITNGLVICYNNGEETIPLDTTYDADNRSLSANITAQGYYFVLDVVDWIKGLDEWYEMDELTDRMLFIDRETKIQKLA